MANMDWLHNDYAKQSCPTGLTIQFETSPVFFSIPFEGESFSQNRPQPLDAE